MDLITIFFVGIAAFVNVGPQARVSKIVLFPAARTATYYQSIELMPHHTFLYVRERDIIPKDPKGTAEAECKDEYQGTWGVVGPDKICTIELNGARIWTNTGERLIETNEFRTRIPSFSTLCPDARDLPPRYLAVPVDPSLVAAHVDIVGGIARACRRRAGAFVTQLDVNTTDGTLYVEQEDRTTRMLLHSGARVAIENKPSAPMSMQPEAHYGWYHYMNLEKINCPIKPFVNFAGDLAECQNIPGVVESGTASVTGPECSNSNYP